MSEFRYTLVVTHQVELDDYIDWLDEEDMEVTDDNLLALEKRILDDEGPYYLTDILDSDKGKLIELKVELDK